MSYLKRHRDGQESSNARVKEDEHGLRYGGYEPAYSSKPKSSSWRSYGGGGGRRPRECLNSGMKGFLCTTNMREKECVREAYNILNEFAGDDDDVNKSGSQKMETECDAGAEMEQKDSTLACESEEKSDSKEQELESGTVEETESTSKREDDDEDLDIDAELANELKELKSEKTVRKFQTVDTGVNNVIFIRTTVPDPTELAYRIFDDVTTKKETKSRFLMRLLPIEMTCYANNMDEIRARSKEVLEKYMKTGYNSFRVVVNVRYNGKFGKDQLIKTMAELVSEVNPLNVVDLKNAQYTIAVEVLKSTLCLGVVKDFMKFRKYNLLEAGTPTPPPASEETSKEKNDEQKQPVPQIEVTAEVDMEQQIEEEATAPTNDA
ncbi:THUMP domain-containing protein 1 [Orchesella cincta]|uniref:THUMP domain-containing protein 1 n=1 Tax=Orchesella cincta TaxID=48709 RepID=A0A1D2N9X0_ORCCI|nr:THUMP domain-containing protein 1 [Orchesella cincta]